MAEENRVQDIAPLVYGVEIFTNARVDFLVEITTKKHTDELIKTDI